jgi:hypothetical protein
MTDALHIIFRAWASLEVSGFAALWEHVCGGECHCRLPKALPFDFSQLCFDWGESKGGKEALDRAMENYLSRF